MAETWLHSEIAFRRSLNENDFPIISREEAKGKGLEMARCGFIISACTMDLVEITLLNGKVIKTNLQNLQQFEDDSEDWKSVWLVEDDESNSNFYIYERAIASVEFLCSTQESDDLKIELAKKLGVYEY